MEALVVVPVPTLVTIFLTVLDVNVIGALEVNIPTTWDEVPVAFKAIEFATVPPILFPVAVHVVVVAVLALSRYKINVPEPVLATLKPPILLVFDVQVLELKL